MSWGNSSWGNFPWGNPLVVISEFVRILKIKITNLFKINIKEKKYLPNITKIKMTKLFKIKINKR